MQAATKTKIQTQKTTEKLQAVKEKLIDQTLTVQETDIIGTITDQITQTIDRILILGQANIPDFEEIGSEWSTVTSRIHELETMAQMMKVYKEALKDIRNEN